MTLTGSVVRKTERALAVLLALSVVGTILAGLFLSPAVSSATAIPPEDTDFVLVDDYWPIEKTVAGQLVYRTTISGTPSWGGLYGHGPADGSEGYAIDPNGDLTWGNHLDRRYVQFINPDYGVWDLGSPASSVVMAQSQDHGPYPAEAFECKLWGSNDFDLSNPSAATWIPADLDRVYRKGWSDVGQDIYAVCNDDYVTIWDWKDGPGEGDSYRFVKLQSIWASPYDEPEVDAVMVALVGPTAPEAECGWQSSVLERGRTYSYTSLEISSDNRTHIAFGGEQLYYAVLDGSTWQVEMVDKGGVGRYCSLALDAAGSPRISYYDAVSGDLRFAQRTGGAWTIQTVESAGDVGKHSSLALDGLGRPGISYYDETNDDLKYAHWNGLAWDIETVDSAGWVGQYTSLAYDGSGNPHVSYYDGTGQDLKYARWNGVAWTRQTVDADGDVGSFTSLALDAGGSPGISYHDVTHGGVRYAHWSGTAWQLETVDSGDWMGEHTSLAFDSLGQPHISYYDDQADDLKCATWSGTKWDITKVDSAGDVGSYTSIDVGPGDWPAISYFDATNETLKCARWNGAKWVTETVSGVPWVGRFTSLAFDSQGDPGISYYDLIDGDLKYAHWAGEYWLWAENTWSIETVDSAGDVGRYTSLRFDALDNPCISYYDVTNGNLKYAHWNGFNWEIATVDSGGDVGSYSSLVIDDSGNPAISYYDATNGNLKYARWTGAGWEISTVDNADDVGRYSSLALDGITGYPGIAYYDGTNGDLRYASWDGAAWNVQTVDTGGDVGSYCSLAFDCFGKPSISYHDATNGDLKYARWGGTYWVIEVVDDDGWAGSHTSLVFDGFNNPAISYHEASEGDLRYAHWNGQKWDIESVDISDWAGRYTSIAFDGCATPFISYDTATNGDLKYAYIRNPAPHQPANESPVDGADHLGTGSVVLRASAFSDPCIDDNRASQWQITTTPEDFCTLVYDSGVDGANLVQIQVPAGVLSPNTTYHWRVRYQDCHGAWSDYSVATSFRTGAPPRQPANISPVDGALDVNTAAVLVASAFSDPEAGDSHAASQWQVTAVQGDYSSPVFDRTGTQTELTRVTVPSGVLGTATTYYWRVRYQDSHGAWSEFSAETSFTTAAIVENPPLQPVNVSPAAGEIGVSPRPTLRAGAFSDPEPGDTHAASQWRITLVPGEYSAPVFDSGRNASALTEIIVSTPQLQTDTAYYWQVRYQDSQGGWSDWSAETGFTTGAVPAEAEEGIPTALLILATVVSVVILAGVAAPLMLPL